MDEIKIKKRLYIGTADNYDDIKRRVHVELRINTKHKTQQTIEHREVTDYYTVSICGEIGNASFGQNIDTIAELHYLKTPQIDLQRLKSLWKEWHLNDMQPNCIHQVAFPANEWDERAAQETEKCPDGYRYGSKWLLKEAPQEIIDELCEMFKGGKDV